jgi:hypothetical protein
MDYLRAGFGMSYESLSTPMLLIGIPIGTTGSYNSSGNIASFVFDGNIASFFDAPTASGCWTGMDLGAEATISNIAYSPRPTFESRMVGGQFQGSSTVDFSSGVATLYTVTVAPKAGVMTSVPVTGTYQYVRYLGPTNGYCNIAECMFVGTLGTAVTTSNQLTGTPIGTAGSWENQGNTIAKVFDGDVNTFFDSSVADHAWVGLDLGTAKTLTSVNYVPRNSNWSGFQLRMVGGVFQASNDPTFATFTTLGTVTVAPPVTVFTKMLTNTVTFVMLPLWEGMGI